MKERNYECRYCKTRFVHEDRFMKHRCQQMERHELFESPIGQAAWLYYQEWMKAYRRQPPKSVGFLKSKFFKSFVRFAKFVKETGLPDPSTFILLMKERDISPTLWTNDQIYALYLEFLDRRGNPTKQAEITIDTLFNLAEDYQCDVNEVFNYVSPSEIIQLLRARRLSPWILLNSKAFMEFFVNQVNNEERLIIESIVRPQYWATKFRKHPDDRETMKMFVKELNM